MESLASVTHSAPKHMEKKQVGLLNPLMLKHNLKYTSTRRHSHKTPLSSSEYRPELDSIPYCSDEHTTIYQYLMGMHRWMCELGRVGVLHKGSLLFQYIASSCEGHLQQTLNIFKYIKHNITTGWLIFDKLDYEIQ